MSAENRLAVLVNPDYEPVEETALYIISCGDSWRDTYVSFVYAVNIWNGLIKCN